MHSMLQAQKAARGDLMPITLAGLTVSYHQVLSSFALPFHDVLSRSSFGPSLFLATSASAQSLSGLGSVA